MNQSAADKAYRHSALPFAIFILVGGVVFAISAFTFPADAISMPPLEAEMAKRGAFLGIAVMVFIMGVGFLMRRVWALYAFILYILLGTAWQLAVGLSHPEFRWLLFSPLFNFPIGFGIYWVTRDAFVDDTRLDHSR